MVGWWKGALNMLTCAFTIGILIIKWVLGLENVADMHTKNVPNPLFEKFGTLYVGKDQYFVELDTPER